ncbi:uncharacterized protein LOC125656451, partial [Ostrea edulis]|uniref:uncharacterized protein LOC125656451 n=1 Tax=Ostrea edulis TaxID=37623 RepID=UPI0024AF794C
KSCTYYNVFTGLLKSCTYYIVFTGLLKCLSTTVFLIHLSTSQKPGHTTYEFGKDCSVTAVEQDFGSVASVLYSGSPVNSSCDEMSFTGSGQYLLCYKPEKYIDPDCAVELHVYGKKDGKAGKVLIVLCEEKERLSTLCIKSNATLQLEFKTRYSRSLNRAAFSGYVYTKNATDEFDWRLFTTVIGIVVPVTVCLVAGVVAACCFCAYKHRKLRASSAYNRNPPHGSYPVQPTPAGNYSTPPPPYDSSFGTYDYSKK